MIRKAVSGIALVVVVALACAIVGVRIVGIQPFAVLSGSMEPDYPVGSLVYVAKAAPEEVRVGDVITFEMPGGQTATHRVVQREESSGELQFVIKGDANEMADGRAVPYSDVIGKVVFDIPYLGYFTQFMQTPVGKGIAVAVCVGLMAMMFWPRAKD